MDGDGPAGDAMAGCWMLDGGMAGWRDGWLVTCEE
jgi:hypothetical protein